MKKSFVLVLALCSIVSFAQVKSDPVVAKDTVHVTMTDFQIFKLKEYNDAKVAVEKQQEENKKQLDARYSEILSFIIDAADKKTKTKMENKVISGIDVSGKQLILDLKPKPKD